MASRDLTLENKVDGEALLSQLRSSKIAILAAFWNYRTALEDWQLVIVSPQTEDSGPRYLLRLTNDLLSKIDRKSGLTYFDVSFQSPRSHSVMELMSHLDTYGFTLGKGTTLKNIDFGSKAIGNLFIYVFDKESIVKDNMPDLRLAAE